MEVKRGAGVTHEHPGHWHDELHLVLIEDGAGVLIHRGNSHLTAKGCLFVVPPGEVHGNRATVDEGCSFRTVNVLLDQLAVPETVRRGLERMPVMLTARPDLVGKFRRFHQSLSQPASLLEQESQMFAFLTALQERVGLTRPRPSAGEEPGAVRAAREYLDAYYYRNVSLAELVEVTGLSPYHLVRVFKRAMGLPPHAYLKARRITRAQSLLHQGCRPADVAARLGFADQPHFSRHFKKIVGVPPGLYQGQSKNVQDPARLSS